MSRTIVKSTILPKRGIHSKTIMTAAIKIDVKAFVFLIIV